MVKFDQIAQGLGNIGAEEAHNQQLADLFRQRHLTCIAFHALLLYMETFYLFYDYCPI